MMKKEELIKAWKAGVLGHKGKDMLIDILLNPDRRDCKKEKIADTQKGVKVEPRNYGDKGRKGANQHTKTMKEIREESGFSSQSQALKKEGDE